MIQASRGAQNTEAGCYPRSSQLTDLSVSPAQPTRPRPGLPSSRGGLQSRAPILAIGLFCAGAFTEWSGKRWLHPVAGVIVVVFCLLRGDNASAAFSGFFAMVALHGVFGIARLCVSSSR